MVDIKDTLRDIEFFHDINSRHLECVAAISKIVEFPAHFDIFREHDPADIVYFIISGRVSLAVCAPRVGCRQLVEVGSGELIGWSPLVGRARLSDSARTLAVTKAVAIDGSRILGLCEKDPEFGFEFMRRAAQTLASRLSATRLQLLESNGLNLPKVQLESD